MVTLQGGVSTNAGPPRTSLSGYGLNNSNPGFVQAWNNAANANQMAGNGLQAIMDQNIANGSFNAAEGIPQAPLIAGSVSMQRDTPWANHSVGTPIAPQVAPTVAPPPSAVATANASTGPIDVNVNQSQAINFPKQNPLQGFGTSLISGLLNLPSNNFNPPQPGAGPTLGNASAPPISPISSGPNMPTLQAPAVAQSPFQPGTGGNGGMMPFMMPQTTQAQGSGVSAGGIRGGGGGEGGSPSTGGGSMQPRKYTPAQQNAVNQQLQTAPPRAVPPLQPAAPANMPPLTPVQQGANNIGMGGASPLPGASGMPGRAANSPAGQALAAAMRGDKNAGGGITADDGQIMNDTAYDNGADLPGQGSGVSAADMGEAQSQSLEEAQIAQQGNALHNDIMQKAAMLGPQGKKLAREYQQAQQDATDEITGRFAPMIDQAQQARDYHRYMASVQQQRAAMFQAGQVDWQQVDEAATQYARRMVGTPPMAPQVPHQGPRSLGEQLGFRPRAGLFAPDNNQMQIEQQREYGQAQRQYQHDFQAAKAQYVKNFMGQPKQQYDMEVQQMKMAETALQHLNQASNQAQNRARLITASEYAKAFKALDVERQGLNTQNAAIGKEQTVAHQQTMEKQGQQRIATSNRRADIGARGVGVQEQREKRIAADRSSQSFQDLRQSEIAKNQSIAKKNNEGGSFNLPSPEGGEEAPTTAPKSAPAQALKQPPSPPQPNESAAAWVQRMKAAGYSQEQVKQRWMKYFPAGKMANAG